MSSLSEMTDEELADLAYQTALGMKDMAVLLPYDFLARAKLDAERMLEYAREYDEKRILNVWKEIHQIITSRLASEAPVNSNMLH